MFYIKMQWDQYWSFISRRAKVHELEIQRAFYAGAASMFELMMASADGPEDQADKYLTALQSELHAFAHRVGTPAELLPAERMQ